MKEHCATAKVQEVGLDCKKKNSMA
jgi:hypothetical protein